MKKTIIICGVILTALTLAACATNKNTVDSGSDTGYKSTTVHDYKGERS